MPVFVMLFSLVHTTPPHRPSTTPVHHTNNRYITRGLGQHCDDALITETYPWPTCALHLSLVTDYPDWYGWVCESQHSPHGYVHVWIGGMLNCEETLTNLSDLVGKENADLIKLNSMNRKTYWQEGFFECEGHAEDDVSVDEVRVSLNCCLSAEKTCYINSRPADSGR